MGAEGFNDARVEGKTRVVHGDDNGKLVEELSRSIIGESIHLVASDSIFNKLINE